MEKTTLRGILSQFWTQLKLFFIQHIRNGPGDRSIFQGFRWITKSEEWQGAISALAAEIDEQRGQIQSRIESLSSLTPDVWSYWDFLYFSTILQTTVGLGDILPNSTAVRMVVTTQIMIGYVLLIVVLNIVLG